MLKYWIPALNLLIHYYDLQFVVVQSKSFTAGCMIVTHYCHSAECNFVVWLENVSHKINCELVA